MGGMARLVSAQPVTEAQWEAMTDPVEGRLEILDGRLFVNPSPNADHNRSAADLAALLRRAIRLEGLDYHVTGDVEWRVLGRDHVSDAPRGDVVVGRRLDPVKKIHTEVPVLVAEIWSAITEAAVMRERRVAWARLGVAHYWELQLGDIAEKTRLLVFDLATQALPAATVTGNEEIRIDVPFPVAFRPAEIDGWVEGESLRADTEARRADRAENENAELKRLLHRFMSRPEDSDGG